MTIYIHLQEGRSPCPSNRDICLGGKSDERKKGNKRTTVKFEDYEGTI